MASRIVPHHSPARFTSSCGRPRCRSRASQIPPWCGCCWSACADDRLASEHSDLDCSGRDRLAAGLHRAERVGTNEAGAESVLRARVCVSWAARRFDQSALVRWRWFLFVREAAGTRALRVATSHEWHGFSDAGAVIDAAGRHRLATTGANLGAAVVGVTHKILSTTFFARAQMETRAFMRYSAHGSDRAPRSERSSGRGAARIDPGTTRATALARTGDRASAAAAGQATPYAVWTEVGEATAADRAVGVAVGGTGIESQRGRTQRGRTDSRLRLLDSNRSETDTSRSARSSAAANAPARAERNGLSGMSGRVTQVRRGCLRDAGVRARQFRGDSSRAHEAELHEVRLHCASGSAEPPDRARPAGAGTVGACVGLEIL